MLLPARHSSPQKSRRVVVVVVATVCLSSACERLAGTTKENVALAQAQFDSLMNTDTALLQKAAARDSLFAIREVQRRTDSIIRLAMPEAAAAAGPPRQTPTPNSPAVSAHVAPVTSAGGVTGPPSADLPINVAASEGVARQLSRAQALGDSIASAQATRLVNQNRTDSAGDTVRGVVHMDGTGSTARAVLVTRGGRAPITLTGMGVEGLNSVVNSEVVLTGLRASPRDVVVSSFLVRTVNGFRVLDGRLVKGERGAWAIALTDKSGTRKLAVVPAELQAIVGARVWIDENAVTSNPQTYGVITRR